MPEPLSPGLQQSLVEKYTIPDKSVKSQLGDVTQNGFAKNDREKLTNDNYNKLSNRSVCLKTPSFQKSVHRPRPGTCKRCRSRPACPERELPARALSGCMAVGPGRVIH